MGDPNGRILGAVGLRIEPEPRDAEISMVVDTCASDAVDAMVEASYLSVTGRPRELDVMNTDIVCLSAGDIPVLCL